MRKIYSMCLTFMFATITITGCSAPDDLENAQITGGNQSVVNGDNIGNRQGHSSSATHKLIIQNNSSSQIVIWDILADGGRRGGSESFLIHFKGTALSSFTIEPFQTVTYDDFAITTPSSYSITHWRAENETTHPTADYIDTATKILDDYGKTYPNINSDAKYSDWIGIHLVAMNGFGDAFPSVTGNVAGVDPTTLGSAVGANNQITFGYDAATPAVTAQWLPQQDGNILIAISNN